MTYYQQERRARHRNEKGQKWGMIAGFLGSFLKGLVDQRSEASDKAEQKRQFRNRLRMEQDELDASTEDRRLRREELKRSQDQDEAYRRDTLEQRKAEAEERSKDARLNRSLRAKEDIQAGVKLASESVQKKKELDLAEEKEATRQREFQQTQARYAEDRASRERIAGASPSSSSRHAAIARGSEEVMSREDVVKIAKSLAKRVQTPGIDPETGMEEDVSETQKQLDTWLAILGNRKDEAAPKSKPLFHVGPEQAEQLRGASDRIRAMQRGGGGQRPQGGGQMPSGRGPMPGPGQMPQQTGMAQPMNPINGTPPTSPAGYQPLAAAFNRFIRGNADDLQDYDYLGAIGMMQQAFPQTMQFAPPTVQEAIVPYMVGGVDGMGSNMPGLQPGFGQLLQPRGKAKQYPQPIGPEPRR